MYQGLFLNRTTSRMEVFFQRYSKKSLDQAIDSSSAKLYPLIGYTFVQASSFSSWKKKWLTKRKLDAICWHNYNQKKEKYVYLCGFKW